MWAALVLLLGTSRCATSHQPLGVFEASSGLAGKKIELLANHRFRCEAWTDVGGTLRSEGTWRSVGRSEIVLNSDRQPCDGGFRESEATSFEVRVLRSDGSPALGAMVYQILGQKFVKSEGQLVLDSGKVELAGRPEKVLVQVGSEVCEHSVIATTPVAITFIAADPDYEFIESARYYRNEDELDEIVWPLKRVSPQANREAPPN